MNTGISAINDAVKEASAFTHPLFNELGKVIIGQSYLTERLVISLSANSHDAARRRADLAKHVAGVGIMAGVVQNQREVFAPAVHAGRHCRQT